MLFLNNDIEIIHDDWLRKMVGRARISQIGIVGAILYYPNNTVQHAGIVLGVRGIAGHVFELRNRIDLGYFARLKVNYNYSAVTGACLMIRKKVFDEVDRFEEVLVLLLMTLTYVLGL